MAGSLCVQSFGAWTNILRLWTKSTMKRKDGTKLGDHDLSSLRYLSCFLIVGVTPLLHLTIPANLMPERRESHWRSRRSGMLFAAKTLPHLQPEATTLPLLDNHMWNGKNIENICM